MPLRVDIAPDDVVEVWQTFRGNEWDNKGEKKGLPVELQVLGAKQYYQAREGCKFSFGGVESPWTLLN